MWSFIKRHKRKFLIAGGIIGGVVVLNRYFSRKISEWEENQARKYIELRKRQHHFEGTLQTCDSTILSFLPKLKEVVQGVLDDGPILQKLKTNPTDKFVLWEELKVRIFSRAVCELYSECILVIFLRIQLSVLGGYMYVDSQPSKDRVQQKCVATPEIQRKYLSLIHNLYSDGINAIARDTEVAVKHSIGNIGLKEKIHLRDFDRILSNIKSKMTAKICDHIQNLLRSMNKQDDGFLSSIDEANFNKIVLETSDVLENQDFGQVVNECISQGHALLMDRLSECYLSMSQESDSFINPHHLQVPLAKLLPVIHTTLQQQQSNDEHTFVKLLLQLDILKSFSANVYETFSQEQKADDGIGNVHRVQYY